MGDGNSMFSFGNDSIVYQYEKAGEYIIKLIIGYKEGPQDEVEKTITIVEQKVCYATLPVTVRRYE